MKKHMTIAATCAALILTPIQAQAFQPQNNTSNNSNIAVTLFVLGVAAILLSRNGGFASSKSEKAPSSTGAKGRILQKF